MGGYTKNEKLKKERCGFANYQEFRKEFPELLDKSLGYHVGVKMTETSCIQQKYHRKLVDDIIEIEGGIEKTTGRAIWEWFSNCEGGHEGAVEFLSHIVGDEILIWWPNTREEFDKWLEENKEYRR